MTFSPGAGWQPLLQALVSDLYRQRVGDILLDLIDDLLGSSAGERPSGERVENLRGGHVYGLTSRHGHLFRSKLEVSMSVLEQVDAWVLETFTASISSGYQIEICVTKW